MTEFWFYMWFKLKSFRVWRPRPPTFVQEGEVLLDDGEQGDDGGLKVLVVEDVAVLGHVPGRVEHVLQVREQLLVLAGQLLPRAPQAGHRSQVQTTGGGREGGSGVESGWRGGKSIYL